MALTTRILIDDREITAYEQDPKQAVSLMLTHPVNLEFWSLDALREFLTGTIELVSSWCKIRLEEGVNDDMKRKYQRFGTWAARLLKNFPRRQEHAVSYIYSVAMAAEGKGLLHGFGISNKFSDNIKGDPEKVTLRREPGSPF